MDDTRAHWEKIFRTKSPESVSWYEPSLRLSLEFIRQSGVAKNAAIIDVGGGTSTLVDDLLAGGYSNLTVLDVSEAALAHTRKRLGQRSSSVHWVLGDVTAMDLSGLTVDLWHDRAVFHFLTTEPERRTYCEAMQRGVRPDGFVVMATFGPNGPSRCSGLDVVRYSPDALQEALGSRFSLVASQYEDHVTPSGGKQEFIYCRFRRAS